MLYQLKRSKKQQSVKTTGTVFPLPVSNSGNCYKTTTQSLITLTFTITSISPAANGQWLFFDAGIPDFENN